MVQKGIKGVTGAYDVEGNKLSKIVTDNSTAGKTIVTTQTYLSEFTYESRQITPADAALPDYTNQLISISHEEGRIRYIPPIGATPATFVYDYFITDHLGNVRMILTEQQQQDTYPAVSFEDGTTSNEQIHYENADAQKVARPSSFYTNSSNGDKVQLLRKNTQSIGVATQLPVAIVSSNIGRNGSSDYNRNIQFNLNNNQVTGNMSQQVGISGDGPGKPGPGPRINIYDDKFDRWNRAYLSMSPKQRSDFNNNVGIPVALEGLSFGVLKLVRLPKNFKYFTWGKPVKTVLKPLGLGSTGRTIANTLTEQLAMKEILSNPSAGKVLIQKMKDASGRWHGWSKMSNKTAHGVEIHYNALWENGVIKAIDDFKFINP